MNHVEEDLLQRRYNALDERQRCNVATLDQEARVWYHKMIILASKHDYDAKIAAARHVLSPMDNLKSKLLHVPDLIHGIEEVGVEFSDSFNLGKYYGISKRAYDRVDIPENNRLKNLKASEPVYFAENNLERFVKR